MFDFPYWFGFSKRKFKVSTFSLRTTTVYIVHLCILHCINWVFYAFCLNNLAEADLKVMKTMEPRRLRT